MNISYDDTSPYLQFSQEWRVQPDDDASSALFWQNTYHAVQSRGATLRITFNGAGIYIYGSKGPHNAEYSVEVCRSGALNLLATHTDRSSDVSSTTRCS